MSEFDLAIKKVKASPGSSFEQNFVESKFSMLYTKFNFRRPVSFGEELYWPTVKTFQFLIRPEFPVCLLTFSNFVLFHVRQFD